MAGNNYYLYYKNQSGAGLVPFDGIKYLRGHGFFGTAYKALFPILKFLGKHVLSTGYNVASDVVNTEQKLSDVLLNRGKETLLNMGDEGMSILKRKMQKGSGKRRRKSIKRKRKVKKRKVRRRKQHKLFDDA